MSGHSKWSSIKHKKGAADAKRGKLFSKLSRAIIVAAKEGGGDPAGNLALRTRSRRPARTRCRRTTSSVRSRRVRERALDGSSFETVVYEGYGPEGVAVLVEALTDNRNRTASDVRHLFTKHGGNLGATGAVAWQFERRGIVLVEAAGVDEDELVLAAAEAGADDVDRDGSTFQVSAAPESLSARALRPRSGGVRGRVGRAVDGARRRPSRSATRRWQRRSSASSRASRTTTTSRTCTRTSISPRRSSRRSRAERRRRAGVACRLAARVGGCRSGEAGVAGMRASIVRLTVLASWLRCAPRR